MLDAGVDMIGVMLSSPYTAERDAAGIASSRSRHLSGRCVPPEDSNAAQPRTTAERHRLSGCRLATLDASPRSGRISTAPPRQAHRGTTAAGLHQNKGVMR